MTGLVLISVFFIALLLGVRIAFCIALAALAALAVTMPLDVAATGLAQQSVTALDSFNLLAIPFFIFAGYVMSGGGIARRLIDAARALVGWVPGGLGLANVLSCTLFGSVSGSAIASTSAVGSFMGPEMAKRGYAPSMTAALTLTGSTTGLLIPPSNVLIIYAIASGGVSVAALFAAGYVPGLLLALALMIVCVWQARKLDIPREQRVGFSELGGAFIRALPPLSLIVVAIGGILSGIFTATESGAVAAAYALLLSLLVYREISVKDIGGILVKSAETSGIVLLLIALSSAMAWILAFADIPQSAAELLLGLSSNPIVLLLLINLLLLIVGAFFDITPGILIFTPILMPIATQLGIDPVHLGIILVLNFSIGLCTPPVGSILFVGSSIFKVPIEQLLRPLLPYFAAMLVVLLLVTFVPELSLTLPQMLGL